MRVLIIKTSALGDVVQALQVLTWMSQRLVDQEISVDWLVEKPAAGLVALHPSVDQVHATDTKRWREQWSKASTWMQVGACLRLLREQTYDLVIDLQGNTKSAIARMLTRSKVAVGLAWGYAPEWPAAIGLDRRLKPKSDGKTPLSARGLYEELLALGLGFAPSKRPSHLEWKFDEATIEKSLKATGEQSYGIVSMGSRWPNKHMPQSLTLAALQTMRRARAQDRIYLSFGSEDERQMAQAMKEQLADAAIELLPSCNLVTLVHVIQRAKWVLSADSLALHLGLWMGTPSFGFFGPSSAEYYMWPQPHYFQGECPYHKSFEKRCDILRSCPTGACLKSALVEPMQQDLQQWLKSF